VFQVFVFMQIFNQINARKLKEDERNVFSGMLKNRWFNIIMVVTFVV
jgi:Ca2+ transporting ATPase